MPGHDDILASVLSQPPGSARTPSGSFLLDGTSTVYLGGADPGDPLRRMVTAHEQFHAILTRSTTYGALSSLVALLDGHRGAGHERVIGLIDAARTAHEVYATCVATWLHGVSDRAIEDHYPDYGDYLAVGRRVLPGRPDRSPLKLVAIEAVAHAAMEAPLCARAKAVGMSRLTVADLDEAQRPDHRLRHLLATMSEGDWEDFEGLLVELVSRPSGSLAFLGENPAVLWAYAERPTAYGLRALACRTMADRLRLDGFPTVEWNEQTAVEVRGLHEQVVGIAPDLPERVTIGTRDLPAGVNPGDVHLQLERLVVRPTSLPASVVPLTDSGLDSLVTVTNKGSHVFVVARLTDRLLAQHDCDPAARAAILRGSQHGVTVAIRSLSISQGGRHIFLCPLTRPEDLDALRRLPLTHGVQSSVSYAACLRTPWLMRWLRACFDAGWVTGLVDISPWAILETHSDPEFGYMALLKRSEEEGISATVMVFEVTPQLAWLAPMSDEAAFRFIHGVRRGGVRFARRRLSEDYDRVVNIAADHLLLEESWFDFRADLPSRSLVDRV